MPWQKGQTGNPRGRPKRGDSFSETLRQELTLSERKAIAKKAIAVAKEGSIKAMVFIRDSTEGKPAQPVIGNEETPIPVTLQFGKGPAKKPQDMTDQELEKVQELLGDDGDGD